MKSQHTPGPWTFNEDSRWPNCILGYEKEGSRAWVSRVAEVRYLEDADARLIAAAPELLEALTFVRDALDRHIVNHGDYEALCEDLQDMDEPVRAAIAKAKG